MGMQQTSLLAQTSDDSTTRIRLYGEQMHKDFIKNPDEFFSPKSRPNFVTCHPLAPCFVQTEEMKQAILNNYPKSVVGVDQYHDYGEGDVVGKMRTDAQWLSPTGLTVVSKLVQLDACAGEDIEDLFSACAEPNEEAEEIINES